MSRLMPKGLFVNADGTTELAVPGALDGLYCFREIACGECGAHKRTRKYRIVFASDHNTVTGSVPMPVSPNGGCMVAIEEPA